MPRTEGRDARTREINESHKIKFAQRFYRNEADEIIFNYIFDKMCMRKFDCARVKEEWDYAISRAFDLHIATRLQHSSYFDCRCGTSFFHYPPR